MFILCFFISSTPVREPIPVFRRPVLVLQLLTSLFFSFLLSAQVNPEILGGLVVEMGDRTIDYSVSAKIARLNKLLTDTI